MTLLTVYAASLVLVLAGALAPDPVAAQNRTSVKPAGAQVAPTATPAPAASPATTPPTPAPVVPSAAAPSDYVIGPGDVLQISVWKNETLSRVAPVRPDGKISMPLLHDVVAAGLTAMQLRDKIATALAEFLPNPEIAVSVVEVHSLRVSVLGEVQKPGVLELRGHTSILEAIAMAGGFRDFASPSKITVIRTDEKGQTQKIRFNYNKAISNTSDEPNLMLRSGDVIVVP